MHQCDALVGGQLPAEILQLDGQDVDHVEMRIRLETLVELDRQVAVHARHLQRSTRHGCAHLGERGIAQPRVVAEQDQVDEPVALEQPHRARVHVGPPVRLSQIVGNAEVSGMGRGKSSMAACSSSSAGIMGRDLHARTAAYRALPECYPRYIPHPSFVVSDCQRLHRNPSGHATHGSGSAPSGTSCTTPLWQSMQVLPLACICSCFFCAEWLLGAQVQDGGVMAGPTLARVVGLHVGPDVARHAGLLRVKFRLRVDLAGQVAPDFPERLDPADQHGHGRPRFVAIPAGRPAPRRGSYNENCYARRARRTRSSRGRHCCKTPACWLPRGTCPCRQRRQGRARRTASRRAGFRAATCVAVSPTLARTSAPMRCPVRLPSADSQLPSALAVIVRSRSNSPAPRCPRRSACW